MSQNKQLSKEARFIYQVFQTAAAVSMSRFRDGKMTSTGEISPKGGDRNIIIAGGAIRDLYFGRQGRDVDLYYDIDEIDPAAFASALNRIDIGNLARQAGFESVSIRRNSDGSLIGKRPVDPDGEDWGDVSEDARISLRAWASVFNRLYAGGYDKHNAILDAHKAVPDANLHMQMRANHDYVVYLIESGVGTNSSSGGSNASKSHPLKSIEEFRVTFDDRRTVDIELMGIKGAPVDYMMSHFAVKLSRAYYDGAGVHFTSDFMQDARNKTLTVACPIEHAKFDRLFSYYLPKMKKYFPDFEIKVDLNAMNNRDW